MYVLNIRSDGKKREIVVEMSGLGLCSSYTLCRTVKRREIVVEMGYDVFDTIN